MDLGLLLIGLIDLGRMRGEPALLWAFDVKTAFPSLDLLLTLLSNHLQGAPHWWLRARARLWGVVACGGVW